MSDNALTSSRRFGGIARLYGDSALTHFSQAHVCVVGVGGVGSWAVEALARTGIGRLTLIDLDNVAESNANRQLHALTGDFGKAKVTALRERITQINPQCEVFEIEDFVTEDNLPEYFGKGFDFVIDAIDQVRVKAAMAAYFVERKQPFVLSGGAGGQKNPALIQTADLSRVTHDPLLANLRYTLRKRYGFSRDTKEKCACRACIRPKISCRRNRAQRVLPMPRRRACHAPAMAQVCSLPLRSDCIAHRRRWNTSRAKISNAV